MAWLAELAVGGESAAHRHKVLAVTEFREFVVEATADELQRMLVTTFDCEWQWNAVADEMNRRRRARRLARQN